MNIRDRIAQRPTFITLRSNVELTRAEDGGVGYNVLGMIPGTDRADEYIVFTGHHDAWFRGGRGRRDRDRRDEGIAKAIRDGFRARRTLLFLASTNEEYGFTDAAYAWLIGCWYAVTNQRTDRQRKAILSLDFELLGPAIPASAC